jgi:hypothetical protein
MSEINEKFSLKNFTPDLVGTDGVVSYSVKAVENLLRTHSATLLENSKLIQELAPYKYHEARKNFFASQRRAIEALYGKPEVKYPPYTDAIKFFLENYAKFIGRKNVPQNEWSYPDDHAIYQDDMTKIDPNLLIALRRACAKNEEFQFGRLVPSISARTSLIASENIGSDDDIARARLNVLQQKRNGARRK